MRPLLFATALLVVPAVASAATIVTEGGGPYDVTSDTQFTGIAISEDGGAGTYTVDFFSPSAPRTARAESAVTIFDVGTIFSGLLMTWLGPQTPTVVMVAPGLNDLATLFDDGVLSQGLQFAWTASVDGAGFGFDVATSVPAVPLPATGLLLLGTLGGMAAFRRRRRAA